MQIHLIEGPVANLRAYASIPISFVIRSRLDLDQLWLGEYSELPVEPRTKDYDALEPISTLKDRFDVENWGMVVATKPGELVPIHLPSGSLPDIHPVGGAIMAWNTPGLDMLEERIDLIVLWDIRVHPLFRGQGVGHGLFEHAKSWGKKRGCKELRVETQDTNVDACRFYRQMGCRVHSIQEHAYEGLDEAKLIWTCRC
jgi:ribosomal protein S18 acetylase RimI-like enzyme